jgi:hypothetical protein
MQNLFLSYINLCVWFFFSNFAIQVATSFNKSKGLGDITGNITGAIIAITILIYNGVLFVLYNKTWRNTCQYFVNLSISLSLILGALQIFLGQFTILVVIYSKHHFLFF